MLRSPFSDLDSDNEDLVTLHAIDDGVNNMHIIATHLIEGSPCMIMGVKDPSLRRHPQGRNETVKLCPLLCIKLSEDSHRPAHHEDINWLCHRSVYIGGHIPRQTDNIQGGGYTAILSQEIPVVGHVCRVDSVCERS